MDGFVLAPGVTDYRKRVQYQTYDVTALLLQGDNTLAFQLADGWYDAHMDDYSLFPEATQDLKRMKHHLDDAFSGVFQAESDIVHLK